jgi:hypothetical protein
VANIDTNVTVNVYSEAAGVTYADYTNICLLSTGATFAGPLVKEYTSQTAVAADVELNAATILAASFFFAQPNHPKTLRIAKITAYTAFETELPVILASFPEIKAVATLDRTKANLLELAATCATYKILCAIQSKDVDILTNVAGNTFVTIKALSNGYGFGIFHDDDAVAADLAWLAAALGGGGPDIRSFPSAYMTLVGVDVSQGAAALMTAAELTAIQTAGGNTYTSFKGLPVCYPGKLFNGDFIDERITASWVGSRIEEAVAQHLVDAAAAKRKVPMNDVGIAEIEGVVREVLERGAPPRMDARQSHFTQNSIGVTVPSQDDITTAQKASRTLPALTAWAEKAGAASIITINVYLAG